MGFKGSGSEPRITEKKEYKKSIRNWGPYIFIKNRALDVKKQSYFY